MFIFGITLLCFGIGFIGGFISQMDLPMLILLIQESPIILGIMLLSVLSFIVGLIIVIIQIIKKANIDNTISKQNLELIKKGKLICKKCGLNLSINCKECPKCGNKIEE